MTILIAHRGNTYGPNEDKENSPEYIDDALKAGFDVEIDLRVVNGDCWLGYEYDNI
jgi:glycerophosphoryl diester phosphodiesterase